MSFVCSRYLSKIPVATLLVWNILLCCTPLHFTREPVLQNDIVDVYCIYFRNLLFIVLQSIITLRFDISLLLTNKLKQKNK